MPPRQQSFDTQYDEHVFENDNWSSSGSNGDNFYSSNNPPDASDAVDDNDNNHKSLYKTLEIPNNASPKEIKTAYKRLSRIHHPDKNGGADNGEQFKEISNAYEILNDPTKRDIYDKYGLDGLQPGGGVGAADHNDFSGFGDLFGRSQKPPTRPQKGPNINYPLNVSLEDMYNGKTKKLAVNRKVVVGESKQCSACKGSGMIVQDRKVGGIGFMMAQQTCTTCQGIGEIAERKNKRTIIEVYIEKGMPNKKKTKFRGMGDEYPGNTETGDVNVVIQEKPHDIFKRKGADLLVNKDISLNQALCGYTWKFSHLDGRKIVAKTNPGEVISSERRDKITGEILPVVKVLRGEGMPSYGNPFIKGDLYIRFYIRFPKQLSLEQVQILKTILSPEEPNDSNDDDDVPEQYAQEEADSGHVLVEDVHMEDANPYNYGKGGAMTSSNEYDSDDDMDTTTDPVQCQQS